MKTSVTLLKFLVILCGTFATTPLFGQTTYTWTGAGDGTNLANPANWTPYGIPNGATQDTGQWDGLTTSNLFLTYGLMAVSGTGFGTLGVNWNLTPNQTNSVNISSPVADSANLPLFGINVASNAGAFSWGNDSQNVLNLVLRPSGATHDLVNNSTNAAAIYPNVKWEAGGGTVHVLLFDGTGNWIVNNYLSTANGTPMIVAKDGTGTMTWTGASVPFSEGNSVIASPFVISNGTVALQSGKLLGSQAIQNNGTLLEYDAPAQSGTLSGVISGAGPLRVNNGTLTLSGANTYTGSTTLSGGELVAGGAENGGTNGPLGVSNTISFTGGTLGFSVNNTFDYSPRFSTAASQAYSFDTGGQSVTFATGLSSSGGTLTKAGAGTLTLAGSNTYSGPTTVNAGELVFQGSMSGSGNITVADGAALGVTATGTPVAPGTLILGTSAGATLEFNNVNSTTTAPLAAGTLSSAGTLTINVNSGTLTVRRSYPLLTWTSGSAPTVALGTLSGCMGNLSISGNTLYLTITGTSYVWTGLNNGSWDLTTPNNWKQNGGPAIFTNGGPALFDDTAPGTTTVTINALVWPASVTVNNSILIYSITSSPGKDICGGTGLSKSGSATLTLSGGANTYTSVTTVSGGTLSVSALANGGSASDIGAPNNSASNLVLNGGALQYTGGGVSCDRLFTLGAGGGAIDASGSGALTLNNTGSVGFSGTGARTLTLTGADTDANTLAAALADHGGATSLTKNGAGTWVLTGTNTYSGVTTIASGTLQIGAGGASGAIGTNTITDNGSLIFDSSGTLTIGVVSGTGSVTQQGSGRVILPGNNTYSGGTAINAGTLQIGNGGATGSLYNNSPIVNNGTLIFNSTGSFTLAGYNAAISGTGQLIKQGSGLLQLLGAETYTGGTTIFPGAQLQVGSGNQGSIVGNITNNGSLLFVRQDNGFFVYSGNISGMGSVTKDVNNFNPGDVTLTGTNTYTGGTIIKGGAIILGDGVTPGAGSIVGNVLFTNSVTSFDVARTLIFNRPDNFTFSGLISGSGSTNAANMGAVLQEGFGTVTLTANNTYTGSTTVSNGTLVLVNGSVGGDLNVSGGTLLPGAVGSVGALDVGGNMSISSGTVVVTLNKALSPSNSMISVAGSITNSGGTLKLLNFGPNLVVGDHFAIFSQPVTGAAMTIVSPGFTVANHLAVNGSVTVSSVAPPGTGIITAPLSGGQLNLSWPASYTGLHLQMQTDPLTAGIGTNWVTIPGTDGGNSYSTAVSTNACVFYRLAP